MALNGNLRDAAILQDFTLWLAGVGKIGTCATVQLPEVNMQMEDFRGGGMDGTVELPMGIEKMECSFDLINWDVDTWKHIGYGASAMDVNLLFRGYTLTAAGAENSVEVTITGGIKSVKNDGIESGKKSKQSVKMSVRKYTHVVAGETIVDIDIFNKVFKLGSSDKSSNARSILGFPVSGGTSNTISAASGLIAV